jgi:hypothetical protein
MSIDRFVAQSIGRWKSQRSAHSLAFQHFEAVLSTIDILTVEPTDTRVIDLCKSYDINPSEISSPFYMQWEGTTDWDDDQVMKGSTVLVCLCPIRLMRQKDGSCANRATLRPWRRWEIIILRLMECLFW